MGARTHGHRHGHGLCGSAVALSGLAVAWLLGTVLQLQQATVGTPALMGAVACGGLLAVGAASALARRSGGLAGVPGRVLRLVAHFLAVLALGAVAFGLADLRAQARLASALDPALEGRDLVLTGTVADLPRVSLQGTRFVFEVESARAAGAGASADVLPQVPRRLSLAWFTGFDGEALLGRPPQPLVAGDRWMLTVRLKRPHGPMNPHGFDLERWLFEQELRATGYVRPGSRLIGPTVEHPIDRLRQHLRDEILLHVDDPGAAAVVAALAVGDQAAIDRDAWELFRVTGVAHLMSISGLHVTMFAWVAAALVGAAWRRSERLALAWPAPTAARWGGLALAFAYALVAGFGVPAQRTVLMLAVVVALRARAVQWPAPPVLLAAAVAVTLLEPWALLQPGFWLSFAAVGLLMLSTPAREPRASHGEPGPADPATAFTDRAPPSWLRRLRDAARSGLRTQVVASLGLAPLTLVFFQQVSVAGFAANLFAIPWVTLVVTPLALLGVLLPPLWALAGWAVQALTLPLQALAALPGALWWAAAAPAWAVAAGLLGGALLVLPLPLRLRLLGLLLLLPLLAPPVERPAHGQFEAVAADVGQGTAVLVRTRMHLLVYDTGPRQGEDADAGERIVLPLLRARGEQTVDLLVLSHRDIDHVGGAQSLVDAMPVRAVLSSLEDNHPLLEALRVRPGTRRGEGPETIAIAGSNAVTGAGSGAGTLSGPGLQADARPCAAGQRWHWDGVDFEMLHPLPASGPQEARARPNARSCVLQIRAADGRRLLLTGDIEAAQEEALIARAGARLRSEVLVVPHHGSRTSSTLAFVDAVAPEVAVVQAGYRNRFGHPVPEVVGRYQAQGADLVRSDRCGAWTWTSQTGVGICERDRRRRYWHMSP
jgi:competence protein ComEC